MTIEERKALWKREEDCACIKGWDFPHIHGRDEEAEPPWDYEAIVRGALKDDMKENKMEKEIRLRPIHKGDWKSVQKLFTEFNASEFGKYDPIEHTDEAHVHAFLESMVQNHVIYAVSPANSDEMIGYICFHVAAEEYDLGYMIASEYRGAGIAVAASRLAMEKLKVERGAKYFTATVAAENAPSVRVLEKLGFALLSESRVETEGNGVKCDITERRYTKRF